MEVREDRLQRLNEVVNNYFLENICEDTTRKMLIDL